MRVIRYIKDRLNERSTWMLFGASVATASALPHPWSIASVAVGVVGAMIPDGAVRS